MSKRLGGIIIGCKYKTSSWHLNGFPDGNDIGSTVYNPEEKPTVNLYTYINRYAGTPDKNKTKTFSVHTKIRFIIIYSNKRAIGPCFIQ